MKTPAPEELDKIQTKLYKYIGEENTHKFLQGGYLNIHFNKLFYISEMPNMNFIPKSNLVSFGTQLGKFTKSGQFHLTITCLHLLLPYIQHKVWIKNSSEMNYLYGNDVIKAHVYKMSDDIKVNSYVFVFNENDCCLGFGVASKGSNQLDLCDRNSLVVVKQTDCGEYLRDQNTLFC